MATSYEIGARVRVSPNCPLTLPHFARVLVGTVLGETPDGLIEVDFGDRTYPLAEQWLERVPDDAIVDADDAVTEIDVTGDE